MAPHKLRYLTTLLKARIKTGSNPDQALYRLTVCTTALIFVLITLGGIVRVTGSGLGCPDWPLCHGQILPPFNVPTLIEYSHRLVTTIVGALAIWVLLWIWTRHRKQPLILIVSSIGVGLLLLQILLGGITVLTELNPKVVIGHLAIAQAFFATYIVLTYAYRHSIMKSQLGSIGRTKFKYSPLALTTTATVYVTMLTGSYVTTSIGSDICSSWPSCNGALWGGTSASILHMLHRYMAAAAGILILTLMTTTWRCQILSWRTKVMIAALGIGLFTQIILGAMNIWWPSDSVVQAFHLFIGTAVWGLTITLVIMNLIPSFSGKDARYGIPC